MQSISRGCAKALKNVTKEQGNGKKLWCNGPAYIAELYMKELKNS